VFVVSDYAEGKGRLWWIDLEEALRRLNRVSVLIGGEVVELPAGTDAEKQRAFTEILARLRPGSEERLRGAIADLAGKAGISQDARAGVLCMDWDELRRLAEDPLVTIGAHTASHPRLSGLSEEVAREEIATSRVRIEAALGRPVQHLAYPFGDPASAGPREFALVGEAGFVSAVTTRTGHLFAEHAGHMHALPRVTISGLFQTRSAVRSLLSGVPSLVWNRGRRVI
jgi:peptidoglycan/xylan/chitin deacetylase (PgdA/CDA1 family)